MTGLKDVQRDWETLSEIDPFWAVAGPPTDGRGAWDPETLFASGEREIADIIAIADHIQRPEHRSAALDFGCGVGRLTRPLAARFDMVVGYDISGGMLRQAKALNTDIPGCRFVLGGGSDLACFETNSFDLVFTTGTLQTLPDRDAILGYIREFLRIVRPNGLVAFHLPSRVAPIYRLQLRRQAFKLLRRLAVSERTIYRVFRCYPQFVHAVSERETMDFLSGERARVLHVAPHGPHNGRTYFVTR